MSVNRMPKILTAIVICGLSLVIAMRAQADYTLYTTDMSPSSGETTPTANAEAIQVGTLEQSGARILQMSGATAALVRGSSSSASAYYGPSFLVYLGWAGTFPGSYPSFTLTYTCVYVGGCSAISSSSLGTSSFASVAVGGVSASAPRSASFSTISAGPYPSGDGQVYQDGTFWYFDDQVGGYATSEAVDVGSDICADVMGTVSGFIHSITVTEEGISRFGDPHGWLDGAGVGSSGTGSSASVSGTDDATAGMIYHEEWTVSTGT